MLRVVLALVGAGAGGMLCSFYWGGDDAGSWTPWWEVIIWLILTVVGVVVGLLYTPFPLSEVALSFATPMLGMMPIAIVCHILKKQHPDE